MKLNFTFFLTLVFFVLFAGSVFGLDSTTEQTKYVIDLFGVKLGEYQEPISIQEIIPSTDNIKVYDNVREEVTVTTKELEPVAKIRLLTPKNNLIGYGYQKVAEFEIDSQTNFDYFIKSIYLFNLKNNNESIERQIDLKEKIINIVKQPVYEQVCEIDKNESRICSEKEVGVVDVEEESYVPISNDSKWIGVKKISLWTNVIKDEKVEWIPELYGVVVNEWATWTSALDTNLRAYYKMDETSGKIIDWKGYDNNCSVNKMKQGLTGKINNGVDFNETASTANCGAISDLSGPITVNAWVYLRASTQYRDAIISKRDGYYLNYRVWGDATGTTKPRFYIGPTNNATSSTNYGTGKWIMVTGTWDGTTGANGIKIYVNGNLEGQGTYVSGISSSYPNSYFGRSPDIGNDVGDTNVDEVGIWNRVLSPTEISDLNNGGSGLAYSPVSSTVSITFNVYRKNTSTNLSSVDFDSNINALDLNNQTSPFSTIQWDINTNADGNFSRTGYDSNKITFYMDSNKTITVYLTDSTAPTMGATKVSNDFNIHNGFIRGTGTISALASDSGSDINSTGCAYTDNNGSTWTYAADYNGTHCYKSGVAISNGVDYNFNFKAYDKAGNVTTSTQKASYRGDVAKPFTTYTAVGTDNNKLITLACTDTGGSGCNYTKYKIDTGAWTNYSAPFYYLNYGHHTIQFYSVDNVGNTEDTNTQDLNFNAAFILRKPKDEETGIDINATWNYTILYNSIALYGDSNISDENILTTSLLADTNNPYVVQVSSNSTNPTYQIRLYQVTISSTDVNTMLQPYLLNTANGAAITIRTLTFNEKEPIPNVQIKIYGNDVNSGTEILVLSSYSDKFGNIPAFLRRVYPYRIEFFIDGNDYTPSGANEDTLTVTYTDSVYNYAFNFNTQQVIPSDAANIQVNFNPKSSVWPYNVNDINISIYGYSGISSAIIRFYNYLDNNNATDKNTIYSQAIYCVGQCTYSKLRSTLPGFDQNRPFFIDVNVLYDSNYFNFIFTKQYYIKPSNQINIFDLFVRAKRTFGCSATSPLTTGLNDAPCGGSMLLSIIIIIMLVGTIVFKFGIISPSGLGVIALITLGLFTYVGWFYWPIGLLIAVGMVLGLYGRMVGE